MAYSGKISISSSEPKPFIAAFSEIIRYICGDSSTPGRDWQFVMTELDTSSGNFSYVQYTGQLSVQQNNVWMDLPTAFVTEYTFTRDGNTLVEDTDYNLDWRLGKIRFLTGTPPYTVNYDYKFKRYRIILRNSHTSGVYTYVGFLMISSGYDKAQILTRCYKGYLSGSTDFFDTTYWGNGRNSNFDCAFGFWNSAIDLWIFSNQRRIIIVARNHIYYTFCYVGRFLPFAFPTEYPMPLAIITDLCTSTDPSSSDIGWYDSQDSNRRYIARAYFGTGSYMNNQIVYLDNAWQRNANITPFVSYMDNWLQITYMEGLNKVLHPVQIYLNYPLGHLEGCYLAPGFSLSSESIIQVGSDNYILFNDCFRTSWIDFMAIKCV